MKKVCCIILIVFLVLVGGGVCIGYINYQHEEEYFQNTKKQYYQLFDKENVPVEDLTLSKIVNLEKNIKGIKRHKEEKQKLSNDIRELKSYYVLKREIDEVYPDKILNSTVDSNKINELNQKFDKLIDQYKNYLKDDLDGINEQKKYIDSVELEVAALFTDAEKTNLKEGITKEQVEGIRQKVASLKQHDLVESKNVELDTAISIIDKRIEEERIKREEAAKKAAEEKRKRQEEIRNAWVILNVPYISQNHNNVENGCEAASLLMALQYKGYLNSMTLYQYATDMPKSPNNNAQEGFTHDIFTRIPNDVPHWIAPEPLARFGRTSSGNQNVVNITGASLDDLDRELDQGNPVIIYLTAMFKSPANWIEGAPLNLHVQLLAGYNKITNEHLIVDPWTYASGRTKWTVSRQTVENIYNALGKQSVVIR